MIDPKNCTIYNRSEYELQEFFLFCCAVAGKTAQQIAVALDQFLNAHDPNKLLLVAKTNTQKKEWLPFEYIRELSHHNMLGDTIRLSRLGQHTKLHRLFAEVAFSNIDLRTCWVDDLEAFKGIGPKTSRYFILHSRPASEFKHPIAAIDTHVMKWLKGLGYTCKAYSDYENAMLAEAQKRNMDMATLDLMVWNMLSKRSGTGQPLTV